MATHSGNGGRSITVHQAQVRTAEVSIRTLTISGKQVTLAVFRQLRQEAVMDWTTVSFRGLPWGTVNYHPDRKECEGTSEHFHIVWQLGNELRQDILCKFDFPDQCQLYHKLGDQIVAMKHVLHGLALLRGEGRSQHTVGAYDYSCDQQGVCHTTPEGETRYSVQYYAENNPKRFLGELARWPYDYQPLYPEYADQRECPSPVPRGTWPVGYDDLPEAEKKVRLAAYHEQNEYREEYLKQKQQYEHRLAYEQAIARISTLVGEWTDETASAEIKRLQQQQARLKDTWTQRWAEIEALDQLFIAV